MTEERMTALLKEIEADISAVPEWVLQPVPETDTHDGRAWKGRGPNGWTFVVLSFSIEDQGFPTGSRGSDGSAVKGNCVVHLTRGLAEKAVVSAETNPSSEETAK